MPVCYSLVALYATVICVTLFKSLYWPPIFQKICLDPTTNKFWEDWMGWYLGIVRLVPVVTKTSKFPFPLWDNDIKLYLLYVSVPIWTASNKSETFSTFTSHLPKIKIMRWLDPPNFWETGRYSICLLHLLNQGFVITWENIPSVNHSLSTNEVFLWHISDHVHSYSLYCSGIFHGMRKGKTDPHLTHLHYDFDEHD